MRPAAWLSVLLLFPTVATADEGPVHRWRFTAEHHKDGVFQPRVGPQTATVIGPVRFESEAPRCLILPGDVKARHRIDVGDLTKLDLPRRAISVEAWVRIDRMQEWGGIAGAFQDNGSYEKGWVLGYHHSQFFFAVAGAKGKTLTYLHARTTFHAGYWYHVVGTYDGTEQRIFVDGRVEGTSRDQSGDIDYPPKGIFTLAAYRDENELYPQAGRIEEVAIWDRSLQSAEVASHFDTRKKEFPDSEPSRPTVTDWPTYLRDNGRLGISDDKLPLPLSLAWSYQCRQPPRPAWPEEAKNDYFHNKYQLPERVVFDRAFHLVGAGDRVYFGSSAEDSVTCLDLRSGTVRWRFFSEGPVRLAPTLHEDAVLFGSDDGHVYCLRAKDGSLVWKRRLAPADRLIPGNERIISAWPVRTGVLVDEGKAYACAGVFPSQGVYQCTLDPATGEVLERQTLKVTAQGYLERAGGQLRVATGRDPAGAYVSKLKRRGKELGKEVAGLSKDYPHAFIGAEGVRLGGGDGKVAAFALDDGKLLWSAEVEGNVHSLMVLRGRLLVSTDRGRVYCFAPKVEKSIRHVPPAPVAIAAATPQERERYQSAARWIVEQAKEKRGYALVLGCGEGHLLAELANRTEWKIVGVEPDAAQAQKLRARLADANLAGRVAIHQGPLDRLPFADYLFNVVVGEGLVGGGKLEGKREEVRRVLRPHGGLAVFQLEATAVERRGGLEGEGTWTHLYGDPGNTACSGDQIVGNELELLWFGPPGPRGMIDRHHRTTAPLYRQGRLIVPGEDRVTAVDAYNGTILWEADIPAFSRVAAFRDSGSLALAEDALYVAADDCCQKRDPATGKVLATFELPAERPNGKYEWGYLAWINGTVLGSGVKHGSIRRQQNHKLTVTETHWDFVPAVGSDFLFARDSAGKLLWTYRASGGLILNPTLTVGDGTLFFVEGDNKATREAPLARVKLANLLGQGATLRALDLKTGKERWAKPVPMVGKLQHNLFGSFDRGRLVLVGSRNSGTDRKKDTLWYDVHVFEAATGKHAWSRSQNQQCPINGDHGEQERHPVLLGGKLFCEPMAYELATGEPIEWKWPWAVKQRRGCGTLSASANCFFFRSDIANSFDLAQGEVKAITAETRPGCWINLLPAGGLLLAPEASSGCSCNFSVQTSLALVPRRAAK